MGMFTQSWTDSPCPDDYYYQYKEAVRDVEILTAGIRDKTNELNALKSLVKEYLKLGSCDGRIERRELRRNLAKQIGEIFDNDNERIN